jgi:hypothetical protein
MEASDEPTHFVTKAKRTSRFGIGDVTQADADQDLRFRFLSRSIGDPEVVRKLASNAAPLTLCDV